MGSKRPSSPPARRLDAGKLTWAALLGRWVDFAKSAVALPRDTQGRRLRDSVPDLIMLQAVWFALGSLEELAADERALGLDRAAVLIDKHAGALEARWRRDMPANLRELIDQTRQRLAQAQTTRRVPCSPTGKRQPGRG